MALHPWRLMEHKPIAEEEEERHTARILEAAAIMAVLWVAIILGGTVVLLHVAGPGADLEHVVLEVASGLGNVGLTAGISGPELHWLGKLGLIAIMWMGRLEIVPILVLFAALVTRYHRRRSSD